MSRDIQSATQSIMVSSGTIGQPNKRIALSVLVSQAAGASVPTMFGSRPKRLLNSRASQRMDIFSGPLTLMGEVGIVT